ncbi:DExH-box ATP-dependent RNA helicase DExH3 [Tanacetum coccineum]|uniref:RNA helicase n=1 Tax=Tanacetum coccineum TaxID=301880 RepID=A0ABQ5HZI6_9ASTR
MAKKKVGEWQKQLSVKERANCFSAEADDLKLMNLESFIRRRGNLYLVEPRSIEASAHQRRGRAGRVQPGECYHLYPKSVYDSFAEYQLSELLRTPLQSLCLQIKSLQLGSISEFLSRALQPPEPLSVQNAIEYLKIIGALDDNENLTVVGCKLSVLPVEPKLGKMLIVGAIFNCLDPIMTVVAGILLKQQKTSSSACYSDKPCFAPCIRWMESC